METSISMADFYGKYQNENLELIDVREAHEFQAGHAWYECLARSSRIIKRSWAKTQFQEKMK
ncbi:rhodanese-like domain-containing protein [Streptococcus pneumoniae]|nr:rhodanese-like domain-containing protein [Streptococcus pneumoniae]